MESALASRRPGSLPAAPARLAGVGWESWLAGLLLSLYCWLLAPVTSDLAAATFRSDLFDATGDLIYSGQWYGGHHLPAYSVLSPTLGALLGTRLLGALSTLGSIVVFERIVVPRFGAAGRVGALLFALTAGSSLLIGRIPFGLGMFLGLLAIYAAMRARWSWACALAVLSALGSPLAGLFLALAAAAWALPDHARWRRGAALALCGVVPALFMQWAFNEGGTFPYGWGSFAQLLVFCVVSILVLPREWRVLQVWVVLFLALGLFAQLVPSPLGGNVNRFGTVFGAPVLACVLWRQRRWALLAVMPYLIWWPLHDVRRDLPDAGGPGTTSAYYAPLNAALARLPGPARLEIPPTRNHWEGVYVGERTPLARGWERQLDQKYGGLFYGQVITPARYRRWLTATPCRTSRCRTRRSTSPPSRRRTSSGAPALPPAAVAQRPLASVRRARSDAPRNRAGAPHRHDAGLVHAHRAAARAVPGAPPLHAVLEARERRRLRVGGARQLDAGGPDARGSGARSDQLRAGPPGESGPALYG